MTHCVPDLHVELEPLVELPALWIVQVVHAFGHLLKVLSLGFRLVLLENVLTVSADDRGLSDMLVPNDDDFGGLTGLETAVRTLRLGLRCVIVRCEEAFTEDIRVFLRCLYRRVRSRFRVSVSWCPFILFVGVDRLCHQVRFAPNRI